MAVPPDKVTRQAGIWGWLNARMPIEEFLDSQRYVEHQRRLHDPVGLCAWIVTAMSGIDDDPRNTKAELTCERIVATRGRGGWCGRQDGHRNRRGFPRGRRRRCRRRG